MIYYDRSYQRQLINETLLFFLIRQSKTTTSIVNKIIKSPESTHKVSKQHYY